MLIHDRTLPLPSDRARGTLARVARDDTELADQLLQQRLKERLFGEAGPAPKIGSYTLERRVGEGGMGVVYRAHDAELQRSVALKLMHPELGGAAERIRGEARALARLAHPNVVSVHEIGEHEGRLFVAMEFVEGETLRGWIERHRGEWGPGATRGLAELLGLIVQAARGLQAAHAAGLVHRDFKPKSECPPQTPPFPPSGRILADRGDLRRAVCRVMPRHAAVLATNWQRKGDT